MELTGAYMKFIWQDKDGDTEHESNIKLGSLFVGVLWDGKKPDIVFLTEEEIEESKITGCFRNNHWEFERYIRYKVMKSLKVDGKVEVLSACNITYI